MRKAARILAALLGAVFAVGTAAARSLHVVDDAGRVLVLQTVPQRVVTRAFPRTFRLALLEKDVAIAAEFLRDQRVPSAVIQQTAELFRAARAELGEEADHVEAVQLVERWAGVLIQDA